MPQTRYQRRTIEKQRPRCRFEDEVLAGTLAYALDLAGLGSLAESNAFGLSQTPKPS